MSSEFKFLSPTILHDEELDLVLTECQPASTSPWSVPTYIFEMRHAETHQRMGRLTLRIGATDSILNYAGQIGYSVEPAFRGRRLAERSCRLILPLARLHGLSELWITCSPDNVASRRTIERLGAKFIETVAVPDDYPLPGGAIRKKSRFRLEL